MWWKKRLSNRVAFKDAANLLYLVDLTVRGTVATVRVSTLVVTSVLKDLHVFVLLMVVDDDARFQVVTREPVTSCTALPMAAGNDVNKTGATSQLSVARVFVLHMVEGSGAQYKAVTSRLSLLLSFASSTEEVKSASIKAVKRWLGDGPCIVPLTAVESVASWTVATVWPLASCSSVVRTAVGLLRGVTMILPIPFRQLPFNNNNNRSNLKCRFINPLCSRSNLP
jgi:hypothetical protein